MEGIHAERLCKLSKGEPAKLDRETGINLFRDMTLGRRFEDKCAEMYYRGKMFGFVHLYNGQEAVSSGVIGAMKKQHDWFCSTYRDHVHALSAGVPARDVMSELFGKETGLEVKGMRQRQMNLMRVDYVFQNWLQTTQEILKFIANR